LINPTLVVQGAVVRIKAELAQGEFTALAEITSQHDKRGCPLVRHPTFKLLENVKKYKAGMEFWGTFEDILEVIKCPKP
jgi:hypothetical protein